MKHNVSPLDVCMMSRKWRKLNGVFLDAICMRNKDDARRLLEMGADVDAREEEHDQAAITLAAKFGDSEIVELLISKGAKVRRWMRVMTKAEPLSSLLKWARRSLLV